jgi:hypothetical protein
MTIAEAQTKSGRLDDTFPSSCRSPRLESSSIVSVASVRVSLVCGIGVGLVVLPFGATNESVAW